MNTFAEVAEQKGLTGITKDRFVKYMSTRWADQEKTQCLTGYASEWAQRFQDRREYECSDSDGQWILRSMDK